MENIILNELVKNSANVYDATAELGASYNLAFLIARL